MTHSAQAFCYYAQAAAAALTLHSRSNSDTTLPALHGHPTFTSIRILHPHHCERCVRVNAFQVPAALSREHVNTGVHGTCHSASRFQRPCNAVLSCYCGSTGIVATSQPLAVPPSADALCSPCPSSKRFYCCCALTGVYPL